LLLNYQYRAYPNTNQKFTLNHWLRICRYWYNWQLGDRFTWWQENRSDYIIPSGEFWTQAVTIERVEKKWLYISISKLLCWLKVRLHRPLPDGLILKNVLLTKKADGWYASIAIEDPSIPQFTPDEIMPTWDNTLGLDAVLHEDDYLATSDGEKLPSLKSFRKSEQKLVKISQRQAKQKKGSAKRRKLAFKSAKQHQKIARARTDHAYKTAHALVRTGKKVFVRENLNLKSLTKRNKAKKDEDGKYLPNGQSSKSGLNKSWLDAAFGNFFNTLEYIAAKAGTRVIAVNPSYTSQYLCYRDEKVFTDCSIREYWDGVEKILVDRDINAAVNIKRVGLGLFLTLNRRSGKISKSFTNSTAKQALETLRCARSLHSPEPGSVGSSQWK